jgi:outer membrane protein TolC
LEAAASLADLEVERAHSQARQAAARIKATEAGEKAARGWVAAVIQGDMVGVAEPRDMVDSYVAYFTMRARLLQSIYDWNLAVVTLRRSLGEFAHY